MKNNTSKATSYNDALIGSDQNDVIFGSVNDDIILGAAGNDFLFGNKGDDRIEGGEGVDLMLGGRGDDTLIGDTGDDFIFGGAGNDRMIWNNGDGSDTMRGGGGKDVTEVNGAVAAGDVFELGANGDRVDFRRVNLGLFQLDIDGVESLDINGGGGDDSLEVQSLSDTRLKQINFDGGDGNDFLNGSGTDVSIFADGGAGDDILIGGSADDILIGGDGSDLLIGGGGNDFLIGGRGTDLFRLGFGGVSLIENFNAAEGDMLQLQQDLLPQSRLGSVDAMRDSLTYNSNNGAIALGGVQVATIQEPVGGFDINSSVEFV